MDLRKILVMMQKEHDLNNFESWNKCSSKVNFLFELLKELKS